MDSNVASALISGVCSIVSAFGAVYLKKYLDTKNIRVTAQAYKPETHSEPERHTKQVQRPASPSTGKSIHIYWRPIFIIIGSFLFGLLTRALRSLFTGTTHWESLIALIVLLVLALIFAIFHRRRGYQVGFQLENLAMWTGWASGWSLVHGNIWSDFLGVVIGWWLVCALVGGVVVSVGRSRGAQ